MKKPRIFIFAALLIAVSCSKTDDVDVSGDGQISFVADGVGIVVEQTKATAVTSLSSFYVNAVKGTPGKSESSAFNVKFSGNDVYSGGQYWPLTDPSYKFYASNVTLTPSSSGTKITASTSTDVVCAVQHTPLYKQLNRLTFKHIFARIGTFEVVPPQGFTVSGLSVKIIPKVKGTYNLFAGNGVLDGSAGWSGVQSGSVVTLATDSGNGRNADLYMIPGSYEITFEYTIACGDYSQTFRESTAKRATALFEAGCISNVTAALPVSGEEIKFEVSIETWKSKNMEISVN